MSRMIYEDELFEIEELQQEFYEDNEVIEGTPNNNNDISNSKPIKRLTCNVLGCGYQTDRRWDMRRHWNSLKHENDEVPYESDSDIQRSVFTCNLCDYKTAKKFSYDRHKKSTKHRRKKMQEKLKETDVDAEEDHIKLGAEEGLPYRCNICEYSTEKKFCYVRHVESRRHLLKMQEEAEAIENDFIEYSDPEHELHQRDQGADDQFTVCQKDMIEEMASPDDLIEVDEDALNNSQEIIYMPSSTIITCEEQNTIEETRYYMVLNN